jgi:hypothetical protein
VALLLSLGGSVEALQDLIESGVLFLLFTRRAAEFVWRVAQFSAAVATLEFMLSHDSNLPWLPCGQRLLSPPRNLTSSRTYCSELATEENALLALEPTRRTVPTTSTRITANMTAYSAMSWPSSSNQALRKIEHIICLLSAIRRGGDSGRRTFQGKLLAFTPSSAILRWSYPLVKKCEIKSLIRTQGIP